MAALTILLLGPMQVLCHGKVVTEMRADTARALLAYLAIHPGAVHRRDALAGLLWPDELEANARRNLRVALYRLRSAIGDHDAEPPYLLISRDTLQLNPDADVEVDVTAFTDRVAAVEDHPHDDLSACEACVGRLVEAAELYRGDLLAGFSLDSSIFEAWLVTQREGLHVQALAVLDRLADVHLARGAYEAALAYARQQIELEPWQEGAHRQAMRALALSGQRATAVAQYETCRRILDEELGIEPEPATVVLYQRIRSGALAPGKDQAPEPPAASGAARRTPAGSSGIPPQPPLATPRWSTPDSPSQSRLLSANDLLPQGERRVTSFVLAELSGTGAGYADLELWAAGLHRELERLRAAVVRYGGTVVQARETGLVAAFGAEVAHEDDAERAVLAAMGMMADGEAPPTPEDEEAIDVALRVGVTTGEAIILPQGTGGVTVHAAALTQAQAVQAQVPPGTLWVAEPTYRRVEVAFAWAWLGEVRAPGTAPVRAYRPEAPVETGAEHEVGGLRAPLVGRETELGAVLDAVARVKAGIGGLVTVVGEAGIGKSRLVAEAKSQGGPEPPPAVDAPPALRWVEGRWLSYTEGVAYHGWRELLRRLLALPDSCTRESCVALEEQIALDCPDLAAEIYPYLARLLALPVDAAAAAQLDSLVEAGLLQDAIFRAVAELLGCVARRQPLVLVLEDVHWADEASLLLLEYLLALADRAPLLIVVLMRPERMHGCWRVREAMIRDYDHRHAEVKLAPLSAEESAVLVERLVAAAGGQARLDAGWLNQARDRAEGNPFFTAEIVRALLDRGAEPGGLPVTVQEVLTARIHRLPVAARQVLQIAAVIGRFFRRRVLVELVDGPRPAAPSGGEDAALDGELLRLMRAQLIREHVGEPGARSDGGLDGGVERAYIFEHQLTLEAAYESLLHRKRRVLHRRVAETLERLYPEQVAAQLGVLAHHWERAGDAVRAVNYLWRAGKEAADQYANTEALVFYTRALALTSDDDREMRYRLLAARERIHGLLGDREAQTRDLDRLETLAEDLDDAHCQVEVALRRSKLATATYKMEVAVNVAQRAVWLAHETGDVALEASAYVQLAQASVEHGVASAQAAVYLRQALDLARSVGLARLEAEILTQLGANLGRDGHLEGRDMVIQALAFYREQDDRYGEGATLSVLANFCSMVGDYAEAREAGLEALAIFREVGNRVDQGLRLLAVGYVTMCVGLYSEALSYLEDAHTLCGNVGDPVFESRALVYIGTIYDFLGAYDRAWSYLERPLEVSVKKGGVVTRSWGLVQAGLTLIHRGEVQRALTHARRALTFLDDLGEVADHGWLPYHHVLAHLVMGQALARLGDAAGSIRAFQRGFDVDLKAGPRGTYTEVRAGLARVYLERGELEDALSQVVYILRYLEHGHLHGTMEPLRVYLTCYRVLAAGGDPRAPDMLAEGHALLQERAAKIHDAALRRSYLERVVVNRELAAIFQSQSLGAGR